MSFLDKLGGIAKNIGDKTGGMLAVNKLSTQKSTLSSRLRRRS